MFSWLVQAGYLAGNPLSLSRQRTRHAAPRITRYLEPSVWQEVKDFIATMPKQTDREKALSALPSPNEDTPTTMSVSKGFRRILCVITPNPAEEITSPPVSETTWPR